MLLATKVAWFGTAFEGNFSESTTKEIVLKEDDPKGMRAMLAYAYNIPLQQDTPDPNPKVVDYFLGLVQVADKYHYPALEKEATDKIKEWYSNVINHIAENHSLDEAFKDLGKIATAVYKFAEHAATIDGVVTGVVVDNIFDHEMASPLGTIRKLELVIHDVTVLVPELGADLFREMLERREEADEGSGKSRLAFVSKVKCPRLRQRVAVTHRER